MKYHYAQTILALFIFMFTSLPLLQLSAASVSPVSVQAENEIRTQNPITIHSDFTADKKLTLKEKIAVKLAQRQLKKAEKKHQTAGESGKSQLIALLLCIFLGGLGIHRFYLGYTGMGLIYLFTVGLFGIGWLIDTILLIIPNGLTPKGRTRY